MARRRRFPPRRSSRKRANKRTFKAICASCGKELMMEVSLPPEKGLVCLDCFRK